MKKILLIAVLTLLTGSNIYAQLQGKVICADGKPAQYATVSVYKDMKTTSAPVKYAVTTKDGSFTLPVTVQTGWWIAVRHIGSKEYRAELEEGQNHLTIQLELDGKSNLDEVTVKSTYTGISIKGDTIAFDTEHFKTGEEETVSEVLKKLPGMEVSDNGDVSFGGKAVDKVLIDGKDMFSSGSDGVINNMSADAMTGAEILKNYKTNSLIDDYRKRDLTALNIKTNGKIRISGKVSLSAGIKNKRKTNNNILYMGNKAYFTSVLAANNTGETVLSFSDYIKNIVGLDNLLSSAGNKGRIFSGDEASLLFPPQNVYKSSNALWSLSGTYKPSDKFKIQGSLMTNMSDMDAESLSEQLYHTFDVKNTHSLINENSNKFLSFHLRETVKPSAKTEISNLTHFSATRLKTDDNLSENGLTDMFAFQNTDLKKTNFNEELAMNVKMGKGLLSAHISFETTHRNYSYDLLTDRNILPANYEQISVGNYYLDVNRKIHNTTLSPDITYAYALTNTLNLQATVAFNHNKNKFAYEDLSSHVDESLTWNEYSAQLQLSRNKGLFRFSLATELRNTYWNTTITDLGKGSSLLILPSAAVTLYFSTTHQLSVNFDMNNNPIEIEYLLRNPMVKGYSSFYLGSDITSPFSESKNLSLNYNYHNLYSNTMLFFNAGLSDNDVTKAHSVQDSSIVTLSKYDNDGHIKSEFISANLSQGLIFIPVDAKLSTNLSHSANETSLNGIQDEINSLYYTINAGFVSRMKTVINFEIGAYYSDSKYNYSVSSVKNNMDEIGGNTALIFVYKNFKGNIRYSYSYLDNDITGKNYSNLGFRAEYRINKWRVHIQGNNILNIKNMDWVSISANQAYTSTVFYKKIPGYIIGGFSYRF